MNEKEIKAVLFELLKKIAPDTNPESLAPDENIRETLEIDSFDFLQFIIGIDKRFEIKTPEEDYAKITTIDSLVNYIKSKKPVTQ